MDWPKIVDNVVKDNVWPVVKLGPERWTRQALYEVVIPSEARDLQYEVVIPSEARDLQFAAKCRFFASLGMTKVC